MKLPPKTCQVFELRKVLFDWRANNGCD
jgi:hypothetical protein